MMWDHDYGHGSSDWLGMSLLMVLLVALTAAVVVVLVRSLGGRDAAQGTGHEGGSAQAQRLLDERLARGEIDEDDYRTRRDLLRRPG